MNVVKSISDEAIEVIWSILFSGEMSHRDRWMLLAPPAVNVCVRKGINQNDDKSIARMPMKMMWSFCFFTRKKPRSRGKDAMNDVKFDKSQVARISEYIVNL